jgi:NO-binding membrane sensor protein with MHYT domain
MLLQGSFDYRLVTVSIALAMVASYAALDLAGRLTAAQSGHRALWLVGGATAMGLGIWAMHYVGMLAYTLPVPILYHLPTVVLSLLAAIAASAVALFTVSRKRMGVLSVITGSLIMGSGIAAMHYIGMAAMRVPAMMEYHWGLVTLSVGLAIGTSLVALLLVFRVRQEKKTSRRKVISALVMGSAIPLMHYTGMWAVQFRAANIVPDATHAVSISELGAIAITIVTLVVLIGSIVTSLLDRLLVEQRAVTVSAQESELYFRTLAEAVPEIIWTTDPPSRAARAGGRPSSTRTIFLPARSDGSVRWRPEAPSRSNTVFARRMESIAGFWDGRILSGMKKARSSNGSAPVPISKSRSTTSRSWKVKSPPARKSLPTPIPGCRKRCGKRM